MCRVSHEKKALSSEEKNYQSIKLYKKKLVCEIGVKKSSPTTPGMGQELQG